MPDEEETFLDSVLQEEEAPAEEKEPVDPRDAYLPGVVGPRIRQALRGGHGLAGTPRRYGLIVATLVGLASLPTWAVLHTGLSGAAPALSVPTGIVVFTDPRNDAVAPPPVQVRAEQPRTPHHHHTRGTLPVEVAARPQAAAPHTPPVVRREESTAPVKLPAQRPVFQKTNKKHAGTPKKAARKPAPAADIPVADGPPIAEWPVAQWPAQWPTGSHPGQVRRAAAVRIAADRAAAERRIDRLRQKLRTGLDRVRTRTDRPVCPPELGQKLGHRG